MLVYEHQTLYCDAANFTEKHLEALARFNEKHGGRYCTLLYKGVRFHNYVGVIQIGNLTLEILPKIDKNAAETSQWKHILVDMLRYCQLLKVESPTTAQLRLDTKSIYHLYLAYFLSEIEALIKQGLLHQYQRKQIISAEWKGQVDFNKQWNRQAMGLSGIVTQNEIYTKDHLWHQILYQALKIMSTLSIPNALQDRYHRVLRDFPPQESITVNEALLRSLPYNRKTEIYRNAMSVAGLLLLYRSPALQKGQYTVLGMLFDMNRLFEEYIYRQLKQACTEEWTLERQTVSTFWADKTLKPDIVLRFGGSPLVVDTKWKLLYGPNPDDDDLRQIYVYQKQLGASEGWLLYPAVQEAGHFADVFTEHNSTLQHSARLVWAGILDAETGTLNKNLGTELLALARRCLDKK